MPKKLKKIGIKKLRSMVVQIENKILFNVDLIKDLKEDVRELREIRAGLLSEVAGEDKKAVEEGRKKGRRG